MISFHFIPSSFWVRLSHSHSFPSRKIEAIPSKEMFISTSLLFLKIFFLTCLKKKKRTKKSFFLMAVWIIGNIKINYKFHAEEITIQHIETGWCSGCTDKGNAVTSLNCPDTALRSSSYDLRAKNLSLLLIVFLLECNVISLQAELMKHTHITKIGIFLFVLCILSKLSTKDIVLKNPFIEPEKEYLNYLNVSITRLLKCPGGRNNIVGIQLS